MKIQRRRSDRAGRTVDTMKQLYDKQQVFGFVGNVGTPTAVVALPYALDQARRRRNQCCAGAASQVPPAGGPNRDTGLVPASAGHSVLIPPSPTWQDFAADRRPCP